MSTFVFFHTFTLISHAFPISYTSRPVCLLILAILTIWSVFPCLWKVNAFWLPWVLVALSTRPQPAMRDQCPFPPLEGLSCERNQNPHFLMSFLLLTFLWAPLGRKEMEEKRLGRVKACTGKTKKKKTNISILGKEVKGSVSWVRCGDAQEISKSSSAAVSRFPDDLLRVNWCKQGRILLILWQWSATAGRIGGRTMQEEERVSR